MVVVNTAEEELSGVEGMVEELVSSRFRRAGFKEISRCSLGP